MTATAAGVLLIHGLSGSPASMQPWAETLAAEGHETRVPLLPGHGTRWQDANDTGFDDWFATVEAELTELAARHRTVVVCGLSMGGTLALRLAQVHPDKVAGLVLVNPAVMTKQLLAKFTPVLAKLRPLLRRVMPSMPGIVDDIAKPGVSEKGYPRLPTLAALSLLEAWPKVRAHLPTITCPLLLLHSAVDHVVEPENSQIILAEVAATEVREVVLARSYHVATLDHDAEVIERESIEFIRRRLGT